MKKLIKIGVTFLLSICCLTPLSISAYSDDDVTYSESYWNGQEVPMTFGDIGFYSNVNGYQVNAYYRDNPNSAFKLFEKDNLSFQSRVGVYYDIRYEIILPETIKQGTYFNINIPIHFGGVSTTGYPTFNYVRGNAIQNFENTPHYETRMNPFSVEFYTNEPIKAENEFNKIYITIQGVCAQGSELWAYVNSITINESSDSQALINAILPILQAIDVRLMAINSNISVLISGLKDSVENGFHQMNSAITNQTLAMQNHITQSFNSLNTWITNQTTSINNKLQDVINNIQGNNTQIESKPNLENSTNDLDDKINEYDDIEGGLVDDFNTNIGAIRPNNDLITNNDFIKTSTFVATQMTRIYESNSIIQMTITFGLIIGLAFTIIGISVKR